MRFTWEEYFMNVAKITALRSADPKTQVGACIVDKNKHIISTGYNGMPSGCENFPWDKSEEMINCKHSYIVHAELNAILNAHTDLHDCTLYITLFPCNECAKAIVQAGIKKIIYLSDNKSDKEYTKIAKLILNEAGITYIKFSGILAKNFDYFC